MSEEEKELYLFMKNATPEQLNRFTNDDADEFERLHNMVQADPSILNPKPDIQNTDIYSKALRVGYSGLSDSEKQTIDSAYTTSDAAKSGKSLEDVHAQMDNNANLSIQMSKENEPVKLIDFFGPPRKRQYEAYRNLLAHTLGGGIGTTIDYLGNKLENQYKIGQNGVAIPEEKPDYKKVYDENVQKGLNYEGLPGLISDPATVAQLGIGLATGGMSIPAEATLGGTTAGLSHYMNTKNPSLTGTAISTGVGATAGGLAAGIFGSPSRRLAEREVESKALTEELADATSKLNIAKSKKSRLENTFDILNKNYSSEALNAYRDVITPPDYLQSKVIAHNQFMSNLKNGVPESEAYQIYHNTLSDLDKSTRIQDRFARKSIAEQVAENVRTRQQLDLLNKIGRTSDKIPDLSSKVQTADRKLTERVNRPLYPTTKSILNAGKKKIEVVMPIETELFGKTIGKITDNIGGFLSSKQPTFFKAFDVGGRTMTPIVDRVGEQKIRDVEEDKNKSKVYYNLLQNLY